MGNFAVEGQASLGVAPDDVNGFDVGVDNSFGVFVRGNLPVGEKFSLFSRTGYHFTKIGVDGEGFDESASINGFAYGGGLEYLFDGQNGIRADITLLNSNGSSNGIDISGTASTFSLAYVRNF